MARTRKSFDGALLGTRGRRARSAWWHGGLLAAAWVALWGSFVVAVEAGAVRPARLDGAVAVAERVASRAP
jgi:hypothetical protein